MKDRKSDSLFSFRRGYNRYSLHIDKKSKKESEVELKRASWSSFPLLKSSVVEKKKSLKTDSESQSVEDLSEISSNINSKVRRNVSKQSSKSSISSDLSNINYKNFSLSVDGSITNILETGNLAHNSTATLSDLSYQYRHCPRMSQSGASLTTSNNSIIGDSQHQAQTCYIDDKGNKTTHEPPRIIYAHVKTPDLARKTRQQILQELEEARHTTLQQEMSDISQNTEVKDKKVNNKSNFSFIQNNKYLNKLMSKKDRHLNAGNRKKISHSLSAPVGSDKAGKLKKENTFEVTHFKQSYSDTLSNSDYVSSCASISSSVSGHDDCSDGLSFTSSTENNERRTSSLPRKLSEQKHITSNSYNKVPNICYSLEKLDVVITSNHKDMDNKRKNLVNLSTSVSNLEDSCSLSSTDSYEYNQHSITEDLVQDTIKQFDLIANNNNSSDIKESVTRKENRKSNVSSSFNTQYCSDAKQSDPTNLFFGQSLNDKSKQTIEYSLRLSSYSNSPVITDVILEEDSDCDITESLDNTFDEEEESSNYETKMEKDLEMLETTGTSEVDEPDKSSDVQSNIKDILHRRQINKTLKLNISQSMNEPIIQQMYKKQVLRQISEEHPDEDLVILRPKSTSSSGSCCSTPRSVGIDIDESFMQRQKELEEHPEDDMTKVKTITQRLNLPTRRPSYLDWLGGFKTKTSEITGNVEIHSPQVLEGTDAKVHPLTDDQRKDNLRKAMTWLRQELTEMRAQDQQLARQLWHLQLEMQKFRLHSSCSTHQALVEEVTCDTAEQKAYMNVPEVADTPVDAVMSDGLSSILKNIGVTRWNISNRRFSLR